MGYCHTGIIDNTGTGKCVFEEHMNGGAETVKTFADSLPTEADIGEYNLGWHGLVWLKRDIIKSDASVRVCCWYNMETNVCTASKLNRYTGCKDLEKFIKSEISNQKS